MWSKCKSSVCCILNVTAIKHSCCVCWAATVTFAEEMPPQSCSHTFDMLGAMENNRTTACHVPLPWKCSRPCWRERLSALSEAPLTVTPSWIRRDYILAPHIRKHNSCLFYSHGWLKMVVCMEEQPPPPHKCTHQCAVTGMTRCTGTWETQLTLLPWQPSQRITVLQHIRPRTHSGCCRNIFFFFAL